MAYVDTSVLVAYYCPEALSRKAQEAIGEGEQPTISLLVELEFHAALAAKARTGEMEAASARRVLSMFQKHRAEEAYLFVSISAAEYGIARDWIARFSSPLRAPDALHLAAALTSGLALLTADRALARSARHFGVVHRLIA
jgi:predicted nucleic acid-binding protein